MKIMKLAALRQRNQKGATIIEYVLIAALISIGAIVSLQLIGTNVKTQFGKVATAIPAT